jgi:hypothetical protein
MVGNLVAKAATWYRAEPGDLYAATRVLDGRPTPESADVSACDAQIMRRLNAALPAPPVSARHPFEAV